MHVGASSTTPGASRALGAVRAVVGLDFVLFGLVFPILPLYARRFGLSVVDIGAILGGYSLAQVVSSPLWGRLADLRGRRAVLLVALAGSAMSAVGLASANTSAVLIVAVIVNGLSGGSMGVAQAAIADITEGHEHAREFGLLGAYVAMGFVIGPGIAAVSGTAGLRAPFIVAAAIGVVNLAFASMRFPETRDLAPMPERRTDGQSTEAQSDGTPPDGTRPEKARSVRSRWLCLAVLGTGVFGFGAFEATFALFGLRVYGFGVVGASISFIVLGLVVAAIEGRVLTPVMRRFGPVATVCAGSVTFALGFALVGVGAERAVLVIGIVLIGAGYGLISPVLSAAAAALTPTRSRARGLGWQQSVTGLARTLGPAVGAALFAHTAARTSYLVFGAIMLLIAATLADAGMRGALELVRNSRRFIDPVLGD